MILDYIRKTNHLYLPRVAQDLGVSIEQVTQMIVDNNIRGRMIGKVYTLNPVEINWYVEYCNTKYDRGNYVPTHKLKFSKRKDQHHSVYYHDDKWKEYVQSTGKLSATTSLVTSPYVYLELDRESLDKAIEDAAKIYYGFEYNEAIQLFYSGNRSIHIAVDSTLFGMPVDEANKVTGIGKLYYNLAHKIAGDVRFGNGLIDSWTEPIETVYKVYQQTYGVTPPDKQKARQRLENIDPNLFKLNSLIRQPYSIHEKTGKQKIPICPVALLAGDLVQAPLKKTTMPPHLLHWVYECYEPKLKKPKPQKFHNETFIIETFSNYIEGFDPSDANEHGYCGDYYSPFYEDSNPSVRVNINTGYYYDFGMPDHQFDFVSFLKEIKHEGITIRT